MRIGEYIALGEKISSGLNVLELQNPTDAPPPNGACTGYDVSLWFPYFDKETATGPIIKQVQQNSARAKRICNTCSKKTECLAYGLQHELWGIWGGFTERERKSLRRKFQIPLIRREPIIGIEGMNLK